MESDQTTDIVRAVLRLGRRLRAARPDGSAGLAAIAILAALRRLGPVPAVRLAAEERLQPQSLTRQIAALERDGLIRREPGPDDRRELLIHLTPRGLQTLAVDIRARRAWLERAMAATLSPEEAEILHGAAGVMLKLAGYAGDEETN